MEEFDRQIKSKIDSLGEVPGVVFDEDRVWRKVSPRLRGDWFLFTGLFLTLAFLTIILLSQDEREFEIVEYHRIEESPTKGSMPSIIFSADSNAVQALENQDLIDSITTQTAKESTTSAMEIQKTDSAKSTSHKWSEKPKNCNVETSLIYEKEKAFDKQKSAPVFESLESQTNEKNEISFSVGHRNQTIGITQLKKIDSRFLLAYGIQFNRSFHQELKPNEGLFMPDANNQIQVPLGIRYNLLKGDRQFRLHLHAGLMNSFLLFPDTRSMDHNLSVESDLIFDYRIFSTMDGKKGYLRLRLPLYNADIINTGVYKPTVFNKLKR